MSVDARHLARYGSDPANGRVPKSMDLDLNLVWTKNWNSTMFKLKKFKLPRHAFTALILRRRNGPVSIPILQWSSLKGSLSAHLVLTWCSPSQGVKGWITKIKPQNKHNCTECEKERITNLWLGQLKLVRNARTSVRANQWVRKENKIKNKLTPCDFLPKNSRSLLPKGILRLFISLKVLSRSFWIRLSSDSNWRASCGLLSSRACWARARTMSRCSARSLCRSEYKVFPACVSLRALFKSTSSSCRRRASTSCWLRMVLIISQAESAEFLERAVEAPQYIMIFQ